MRNCQKRLTMIPIVERQNGFVLSQRNEERSCVQYDWHQNMRRLGVERWKEVKRLLYQTSTTFMWQKMLVDSNLLMKEVEENVTCWLLTL